MLRKRKPKKLASSYAGLALPKGRSRQSLKRDQAAHKSAVIRANHDAIFLRDAFCRRCRCWGKENDHVHEVKTRAQCRGMKPELVFNSYNTLRLCRPCHLDVIHGQRSSQPLEEIVYLSELGCDGFVIFRRKEPKTLGYSL